MIQVEYWDSSGLRKERLPWTEDILGCRNCGLEWEATRPLGEDWEQCMCPQCGAIGAEMLETPQKEKCPQRVGAHPYLGNA